MTHPQIAAPTFSSLSNDGEAVKPELRLLDDDDGDGEQVLTVWCLGMLGEWVPIFGHGTCGTSPVLI